MACCPRLPLLLAVAAVGTVPRLRLGKTAQGGALPLTDLVPCASSFAIETGAQLRYNTPGGDNHMTQKDLNIIRATAKGYAQALEVLSSDYSEQALSAALCELQDPRPAKLHSQEIGYYAAMFYAWQQRGSPDIYG